MTDTPTKQEIQSKNDNVPGAMPVEQKKNNRNDRKRNRRGDSKNLEKEILIGKKELFKFDVFLKLLRVEKK